MSILTNGKLTAEDLLEIYNDKKAEKEAEKAAKTAVKADGPEVTDEIRESFMAAYPTWKQDFTGPAQFGASLGITKKQCIEMIKDAKNMIASASGEETE